MQRSLLLIFTLVPQLDHGVEICVGIGNAADFAALIAERSYGYGDHIVGLSEGQMLNIL